MVLVHEAVVIDEVPVARVVGRIDVDAFHLPGISHAQGPQGVKIIALDDEIPVGSIAGAQLRHRVEDHEVVIQRPIVLDGVPLPHQPEFLPLPSLEQLHQLLLRKIAVILSGHGRAQATFPRHGGARQKHGCGRGFRTASFRESNAMRS